jgi:retron-type reverse transcriptase
MVRRSLYAEMCSFRNLELAFRRARINKRSKKSVRDFEFNLEENLLSLKHELETLSYNPRPLKQFVIRDPKTRLISASLFRDRVVHHALCNIIQPIFEKTFIYDSHANQISKGTTEALRRFDTFKRKASGNGRLLNKAKDGNMVIGYILKADIRHYFDTVDHEILMGIISRKINNKNALLLIRKILDNHTTKVPNKGMPIGNLTSQFFANLYLNELDHFVKHELKARFYIRYVDDFVLLDESSEKLERYKFKIAEFLKTLELELHPEKSKIYPLHKGTRFLGFRIFHHHKLLRKSNIRKMERRLESFREDYANGIISQDDISNSVQSWMGYAKQGNTYRLRERIEREIEDFYKPV